jgi:hypothetical protein
VLDLSPGLRRVNAPRNRKEPLDEKARPSARRRWSLAPAAARRLRHLQQHGQEAGRCLDGLGAGRKRVSAANGSDSQSRGDGEGSREFRAGDVHGGRGGKIEGRETINDPAAFQKFQESQGELSSALSRLLVAVERYPELKANQNFLELQSQLEGTENRIAVERNRFNEVARDYNSYIKVVPNSFVAGIGGFKEKPYFAAAEGADQAPKVEF